MQNDLISIIIPIFNMEKYLKRCVSSVCAQTYKNIEIILVDDGSSDNSPFICDEYLSSDNRVKVIHKENGGISSARNSGISIAKGKYIGFVDADDYISERMFEILYSNVIKFNSDIAVCNFEFVYKNKKQLASKISVDNLLNQKDSFKNVFCNSGYGPYMWNKLFKKELFNNVIFPVGKTSEDKAIIFDILCKIDNCSYICEPLYYYVQRNNSIIHCPNKKISTFGAEASKKNLKLFNKSNNELLFSLALNDYILELLSIYNKMILINEFDCKYSKDEVYNEILIQYDFINNKYISIKEILQLKLIKHKFLYKIILVIYNKIKDLIYIKY